MLVAPEIPVEGHKYVKGPVDVGVMPILTTELVQVIEFVTAFIVAVGAPIEEVTCTVDVIKQPDAGLIACNV